MNEEFLHFLWKNRQYYPASLKTQTGDDVEVINPGELNNHSGPDFFNAKIKIGDFMWAGNVEIHTNSSDWLKHGHQEDPAYENVILQAVYNRDRTITNKKGTIIPTVEMKFDPRLLDNYNRLKKEPGQLPCRDKIHKVESFQVNYWLHGLLIERLESKASQITDVLETVNHSWEEAFYQIIARNFGFSVNSVPFELLAKSLPLNIIGKHKDDLFQIESLLFGQAGLLEGQSKDEYHSRLEKEYDFLRHKYKLHPVDGHMWKFAKMRPNNFPTIRIAQFAQLLFDSKKLFSKIIENKDIGKLKSLLDTQAKEYWETHYNFGKESAKRQKKLGKSSIDVVIINTIAPFLFMYGQKKGIEDLKDFSLLLLESVPAEKNTIIDKWKSLGIKIENAAKSQALLQLYNNYCTKNKCLYCQIGNKIIMNK